MDAQPPQEDTGSEITPLPGHGAFALWAAGHAAAARRGVERALLQSAFPVPLRGWCACCQAATDQPLSARHTRPQADGSLAYAWSGAAVCTGCGLNSRQRFAVELLRARGGLRPGARVYLTEQTTPLYRWLAGQGAALGLALRGSEWLGADRVPGSVQDGIEHQDIHRLTHADGTFDAVVCLDVLEHVPDPVAAVAELARVLAPGGFGILTFPFFPDRSATKLRAVIGPDGAIQHLLPAQYHGNPLGGGSLVMAELAWDFVAAVAALPGLQAGFLGYWSLYNRHFGPNRFALVIGR
jgi:SAM-dependent methyltransferase